MFNFKNKYKFRFYSHRLNSCRRVITYCTDPLRSLYKYKGLPSVSIPTYTLFLVRRRCFFIKYKSPHICNTSNHYGYYNMLFNSL